MSDLQKANCLEQEIKKMEYFLHTVTKFDREEQGIRAVKLFLKKKITVENYLFGKRFFGIGEHKQEIEIPNEIRNEIIKISERKLEALQKELKALFK